jgi:hypothetical protein
MEIDIPPRRGVTEQIERGRVGHRDASAFEPEPIVATTLAAVAPIGRQGGGR